MGKQTKTEQNIVKDPQEYPISKKRTLIANLNAYIRMLKENFPQLSAKQYLKNVHIFLGKIKRKLKFTDQQKLVEARQKIKICVQCEGWSSKKSFIKCNYCQDNYHTTCLKINLEKDDKYGWCCESCDAEVEKKRNDKNDHLRNSSRYDECHKCKNVKVQGEAFVNCMKCSMRYHKTCYGKPNVVCQKCHQEIEKELKEKPKSKNLLDYHFTKTESTKKRNPSPAKITKDNQTFKLFGKSINSDHEKIILEKNPKYDEEDESTRATNQIPSFTKNFPKMTEQEIDTYTKELMYAIRVKKMTYTPELIFEEGPVSDDTFYEESLNFGLQQMSKIEAQVYEKYQKQPFGPYKLIYKEGMGYDVVADKDLPAAMLVCEYVGQVVSYRKVIELEFGRGPNDSLFELSVGRNADETMYIMPEKYTNLGRFINGVNNKTGKNKINIGSVKLFNKGKPGIFLYTTRAVKKGQSLAYDYNAGELNAYPTSDFV